MPSVSNPEAPATAWPPSTSRAIRPSSTSWRSCATTTEPKKFREVVRELSWLLGYEALADIAVRPVEIETPIETMVAGELADRIGLVPILRAGLGMVDAMLELMPTAQVWHLGLFRDERTLRPVEYYNKLPDSATVDLCLILDPMLATGGSATAAIEVLKRWGAVRIKLVNLIAAPEGVAVTAVTAAHGRRRRPPGRARSTPRARSTASSTRRATSCPASATPATASSGPAADSPIAPGQAFNPRSRSDPSCDCHRLTPSVSLFVDRR
jgi:uracil phosphoribosyltransferase